MESGSYRGPSGGLGSFPSYPIMKFGYDADSRYPTLLGEMGAGRLVDNRYMICDLVLNGIKLWRAEEPCPVRAAEDR